MWQAQSTIRDAIPLLSISGLTVYLLPHRSSPDATYTDGSKLGYPLSSGASAVLCSGTIAVCRVPGVLNSYMAELVGALLGSSLSPDGQGISLDCQGAIAALHSLQRPVRQAFWVQQVWSSVLSRGQSLEWVEGHVGHEFNEVSDTYAKVGTTLPLPPPMVPSTPWDVIRCGKRVLPPTKVWTHNLIPLHTHDQATWLLFTGVPAWFVVLCLRCPGPLCSCSPVRPLGVLCCVSGFLGPLAPVHRCARWVCCVACAVSWATWLLFTDAPAQCVALRARSPGPLGSCSTVCLLCLSFCLCGVLVHLATVHQCARVVPCVVSAVSWATWLLLSGAPARCVVLRVRCPGPLGSRSPVCLLGVLCCVCGVLGHLAPFHGCARSVCCFACAVSWATWLMFTGVPAPSFVLFVPCPGPLGSCSSVSPLGVLFCVCGVVGLLTPVHRCARPWCPVPFAALAACVCVVSWPTGACSPVCALCAVRVCRWWSCPSSSPPNFFFPPVFLFFLQWKKGGRAYTAGTGTDSCAAVQ